MALFTGVNIYVSKKKRIEDSPWCSLQGSLEESTRDELIDEALMKPTRLKSISL